MIIFRNEIKRGKINCLIWTAVICFFLAICISIYPEMKDQMSEVSDMFGNMGNFSAAFGLDQLNFGEFKGYFGVECGNVLGMFGAFYAALLGIVALGREEKEQTAEFLLTHPVTRSRVVIEKAMAILTNLIFTNLSVVACSYILIYAIGEDASLKEYALLFLAYFLAQLEIAMITFAISSFLKKADMGIALGIAGIVYFLGIFSNLMEELKVIKYLTPFGYADSATILTDASIEASYLTVGMFITVISFFTAFIYYNHKEIS